jgi:hypothetical protein
LRAWSWPGFAKAGGGQDKGHAACAAAFLHAVETGGAAPIPFEELVEVSRWSIRAARFEG